ncbi:uncharacterized protein AtWU_02426 [Aspergillus tubingensis]|uniref:uncharacterized protein n=1 Tax=Aspergillus tubingensis TaxID=5068 RepID=UPI0015793B79|nr:uncharacterized protein AtWU_02426 [Aspergillus tubingensis]GFN12629.1 hypothetical protein AtWU_02426 [Aspergillus tubingensis]GLA95129.1 hypothetical protein AtubIFM57143_002130 [Aspergillus tubingensis]GLB19672.1 hypothetical protein AtubIFM61612_009585 [Aspergillus tubingensis]
MSNTTTTTTTTSPINPPTTATTNNNNNPHNIPPYTPMTSLSHELGILFGFLAACFVVMGVYVFFWRAAEFREERAQTLRRQMLLTRGIHHGRGGIGEKFISHHHGHGHGHVHDGRCLDGSTGLHQRNITPENSASAGSGTMYKGFENENEIGVALTTGMDVGIVASPSLGPMTPTSVSASGAGREIPVGGLNVGMGSRMNVNQGTATGAGVGAGRDEVEYGVEMDVLGFLQRGR